MRSRKIDMIVWCCQMCPYSQTKEHEDVGWGFDRLYCKKAQQTQIICNDFDPSRHIADFCPLPEGKE